MQTINTISERAVAEKMYSHANFWEGGSLFLNIAFRKFERDSIAKEL